MQAKEPYPDAIIGNSPVNDTGLDFHYGLASWLECNTPETGCTTLSSPGAFGWTPWYDRSTGYYAIIGTEVDPVGGAGVVQFTVLLAQQLKPAIAAALAAR